MNSKLLFNKYAKRYFKDNLNVLEIGPDNIPSSYEKQINNELINWDTLDLFPNENLTYIADKEYQFPINDNSYDIVLSGQVIEHVRKIWVWIRELSRICKKGGYVIIINPISYPYHEAPYDCWRIYPEGMNALYEEAGLKVVLSKFESLESLQVRRNGNRNIYYGITANEDTLMGFTSVLKNAKKKAPISYIKSLINYFKNLMGWPVPCSLDAITIGIKE